MPRWLVYVFLALALLMGAAALLLLRAQEAELEALRDEVQQQADDDASSGGPAALPPATQQAQALHQQMAHLVGNIAGALAGQNDPNDVPFGAGTGNDVPAEPAPYTVRGSISYGFYILDAAGADAVLEKANPQGNARPEVISRVVHQKLGAPGASESLVVKVRGMADPGPGVNAVLDGAGFPRALQGLRNAPRYYGHEDARDRLGELDAALERLGGPAAAGQRAALWRASVIDPTRKKTVEEAPAEGPLPSELQEAARGVGYEAEQHLVTTLRQALERAAGERKTLLMLKVDR